VDVDDAPDVLLVPAGVVVSLDVESLPQAAATSARPATSATENLERMSPPVLPVLPVLPVDVPAPRPVHRCT
jgi:hypothetical protein